MEIGTTRLLDDPIRAALTTEHCAFARGGPLALRYLPEIAPFAAIADSTARSFQALAALVPPGDRVALFRPEALEPPGMFRIEAPVPIIQMVLETPPATTVAAELQPVVLGTADVAEMLDLVGRTHPGPFGPRTIELGEYIGIRINGTLAAMAGERMRFGRFVEVSAVCVDPGYRGKGYAAALIRQLASRMRARSLTPILHVFKGNVGAMSLYEKLGFRSRRTLCLNVLMRPERSA